MEENNKKLSEKTANENKSEVKINMFENNLNTFSEGEQMNRDYLVHLYNEDMSFLNKEIRMTRSGYIKMYSDIESSYQNRKKETTKQLIPMVIIYVIAIVVAIFLRAISKEFFGLEDLWMFGNSRKMAAYIGGIFLGFSRVIFLSTSTILTAYVVKMIKTLKRFDRYRENALTKLEENKAECMSAGQYDAGK
ncbi:MAG: hypothetical protein SPI76_00110 [Candidatus Fimenecus sp.]|nr:hypothetical protein [Candidatus Fimenecus sp.]